MSHERERVQRNNRIPRVSRAYFASNNEETTKSRGKREQGVGFSSREEKNDRLTNRYPDSKRPLSFSSSASRQDTYVSPR